MKFSNVELIFNVEILLELLSEAILSPFLKCEPLYLPLTNFDLLGTYVVFFMPTTLYRLNIANTVFSGKKK